MEKNILIVDSDSQQRLRIAKAVFSAAADSNVKVKIYKAVNTKRAAKNLEQYDIDMLILNTDYDEMFSEESSGIQLVETLRKNEKYMFLPVVFVTFREELRKYAFTELNCLGYHSYEFDDEGLEKTIRKGLYHTTRRDREAKLCLKVKSVLYPVRVKDIIYIESKNKELLFWLKDGSGMTVSHRTLLDVKEKIPNRCMLQCGRDTIINREYVEKVGEKTVFLRNGDETIYLNVGVTYKNVLKKMIL